MWTIDVDGGAPRRLTNAPADSRGELLPDGRFIYYRSRRADGSVDIWRVPAEGGTPERVTNHAGRGPRFAPDKSRFSADGRTLYYKQADGEAPLVAHPIPRRPGAAGRGLRPGRACAPSTSGPSGVYYVRPADPICAPRPSIASTPPRAAASSSGAREMWKCYWTGTLAVFPTGGPILFTKNMVEGCDLVMIENFR